MNAEIEVLLVLADGDLAKEGTLEGHTHFFLAGFGHSDWRVVLGGKAGESHSIEVLEYGSRT